MTHNDHKTLDLIEAGQYELAAAVNPVFCFEFLDYCVKMIQLVCLDMEPVYVDFSQFQEIKDVSYRCADLYLIGNFKELSINLQSALRDVSAPNPKSPTQSD